MISALSYAGLRATGITALTRRLRTGGVILCYHNVVGDGDAIGDPGLHLPREAFARQLHWLCRHYQVVSLPEFANRLLQRGALRGVAAITFDDGYAGVFRHAWPLLRDAGAPATVFIPTELVRPDRGFWWDHPQIVRAASGARRRVWLTELRGDETLIADAVFARTPWSLPATHCPAGWATIADAAREGLGIGVHSATHRNLTRLSREELEREIARSRESLADRIGQRAECFSYPYGLADAFVRDAVRRAGYRAAVTLDYGLNRGDADQWMLRRVNVPASIGPSAFQAWVAGLRRPGFAST